MTGRSAGDCGPQQGRGFFRGWGGGSGSSLRRRRRQRFGFDPGSGGGGWGRGRGSESTGGDEEALSLTEADRLRAQIDVVEMRLARLEEKK
jgi:hypothetical protein